MPEWIMGVDCKFTGYTYVGSNPTRPILEIFFYNLRLDILFLFKISYRLKKVLSKTDVYQKKNIRSSAC